MTIVLERARGLRPPAVPALLLALAPLALLIGLALLLQRYAPDLLGDSYRVRVLLDIGVAIVLAVSLNIVNGYTGQFSIGHAGFFAIGGYAAGFITYYFTLYQRGEVPRAGEGPGDWLFVGAALAGGLLAAGAGYLVGLPSLRLRGDYLAIVTLGFGEIVRVILELSRPQFFEVEDLKEATWREFLLPPAVGGAQGFAELPKYTSIFWVYAVVAVTLVFAYRLKQSSTGRALLSIREDEIAAQAMGVNITRYKVRAFVYAAFFAGLAGALYAHQFGNIVRPVDAGFMRSFDVIIMVVLGGMGSLSGAALAAILLTTMSEWLREPTHVWFLGVYIGLARVAFTPRRSWRDIIAIAALAAAVETLRALRGDWVLFHIGLPLLELDVQLYELLYTAALLFFCIIRGDVVRSVLWIAAAVLAAELIRGLALRYPTIQVGATEIPLQLGDYRMILYALLLILVMIFRPQGLFGVRELWDFLPHRRHAA